MTRRIDEIDIVWDGRSRSDIKTVWKSLRLRLLVGRRPVKRYGGRLNGDSSCSLSGEEVSDRGTFVDVCASVRSIPREKGM